VFSRFLKSIQMAGRVVKNAIVRPFRRLFARLKRVTNIARVVQRAIPKFIKKVTTAKLRPEKREDYVDVGQVYVAKSLIFIVVIILIALILLIWLVIAPWFLKMFGTAKFYFEEVKVQTYTGSVILYSDEAKKIKFYEGEIEEGVKYGKGFMYDENGTLLYDGSFSDNMFNGKGIIKYEDGTIKYKGEFVDDEYSGDGKIYSEEGYISYDGEFSQGVKSGQGIEYDNDGMKKYEGMFENDIYQGIGKTYYSNGMIKEECLTFNGGMADGFCTQYYDTGIKSYEGDVQLGKRKGAGTEYYPTSEKEYVGNFFDGLKSGEGTEFYVDGKKKYSGSFLEDMYDGDGTLYDEDGKPVYLGAFVQGNYFGDGAIFKDDGWKIEGVFIENNYDGYAKCYKDEVLVFEGEIFDGKAWGEGKLYGATGDVIYEGKFVDDFIDSASLVSIEIAEIKDSIFADATVIETEVYEGMMLTNKDASFSIWCNYGYGGADIVSHRIFFYGDTLTGILKGEKFVPPEPYEFIDYKSGSPLKIPNLPEHLSENNDNKRFGYEIFTIRLWGSNSENPEMIEWRTYNPLPIVEEADVPEGEEDTESEEVVNDLLDQLGLS